ncbi:MAG: protocatechuate 3,4-dioxygenase [Pseudomonadota bacterium]
MAKLSLGFAMSHGPLLALPPEDWGRSRTADMMEIPRIHYRGESYSYEELLEVRQADLEYFRQEFELPRRQQKFERNQNNLDRLGKVLREINPDVLIVVGDDHYEFFRKDVQPSFAVYTGSEIINPGFDPAERDDLPDAVKLIIASHNPPQDQVYPCESELALRIVSQAIADDIDLTACGAQPVDDGVLRGIGHCVGFPYRRVLRDDPIPLIPVLMNTYFKPNQPPVRRCYELGRSIGRAVAAWGSDKTVGIVGSGGLSHFAIDEAWDREVLAAMQNWDFEYLLNIPESIFESGTSEVKNWITAMAAIHEANRDLSMQLIDYVPCYRSEGGTGTATGFAVWT